MTVRELIEALQEEDQAANVILSCSRPQSDPEAFENIRVAGKDLVLTTPFRARVVIEGWQNRKRR